MTALWTVDCPSPTLLQAWTGGMWWTAHGQLQLLRPARLLVPLVSLLTILYTSSGSREALRADTVHCQVCAVQEPAASEGSASLLASAV